MKNSWQCNVRRHCSSHVHWPIPFHHCHHYHQPHQDDHPCRNSEITKKMLTTPFISARRVNYFRCGCIYCVTRDRERNSSDAVMKYTCTLLQIWHKLCLIEMKCSPRSPLQILYFLLPNKYMANANFAVICNFRRTADISRVEHSIKWYFLENQYNTPFVEHPFWKNHIYIWNLKCFS